MKTFVLFFHWNGKDEFGFSKESPVSACLQKEGVPSRDKTLLPTGVQSDSHFCSWQQRWPSPDHSEVSLAPPFLRTNLLRGKSAGKSLAPRRGVSKELFYPVLLLAHTGSPSGCQKTCRQNHAHDWKF